MKILMLLVLVMLVGCSVKNSTTAQAQGYGNYRFTVLNVGNNFYRYENYESICYSKGFSGHLTCWRK